MNIAQENVVSLWYQIGLILQDFPKASILFYKLLLNPRAHEKIICTASDLADNFFSRMQEERQC